MPPETGGLWALKVPGSSHAKPLKFFAELAVEGIWRISIALNIDHPSPDLLTARSDITCEIVLFRKHRMIVGINQYVIIPDALNLNGILRMYNTG